MGFRSDGSCKSKELRSSQGNEIPNGVKTKKREHANKGGGSISDVLAVCLDGRKSYFSGWAS